jgi:two-component system OmpR family response regulator
MAERLLVVDDEDDIREMLADYLSSYGFEVTTVPDGTGMREALARQAHELVLLDLGLPGEDGLSLARELRTNPSLGIIIVTGRGQPVDRIIGLEVGADDYVAKPFELRELLARIRSVLRRIKTASTPRVLAGRSERVLFEGWEMDLSARSLAREDGETVALTAGEFDLLAVFARNPNRVLSRDELMDALHRREASPYDRSIDVQVGRLRRKIERDPGQPALIKSVRGIGYLFTAHVTPDGVIGSTP